MCATGGQVDGRRGHVGGHRLPVDVMQRGGAVERTARASGWSARPPWAWLSSSVLASGDGQRDARTRVAADVEEVGALRMFPLLEGDLEEEVRLDVEPHAASW